MIGSDTYIPGKETQRFLGRRMPRSALVVLGVLVVAGLLTWGGVATGRSNSGVTAAKDAYGDAWGECNDHWKEFKRGCASGESQPELLATADELRACLVEQCVTATLPKGYCTDDGAFVDVDGSMVIQIAE